MNTDRSRLRRGTKNVAAWIAGLWLAAGAWAQSVPLYRVDLATGESLQNVAIVSQTDDFVTLAHPVLGNITLARTGISAMTQTGMAEDTPAPAVAPPPPPPAPAPEPAAEAAPAPEAAPDYPLWTGYADLGLAGTEGNTETINLRTGVGVKRETENTTLTIDGRYRLSTDRGDTTSNQALGNARFDYRIPDSRWGFFGEGKIEYDEFKDFDLRLDLLGGVTYAFIRNDTTSLVGRAGAGVYREFGGPEDEWTPQGVLGLRFEHAFNDRTKFIAYSDYFPSFEDIDDFRVISGAGIEVALNEKKSLMLKAGVEDRYDNQPGTAEEHDIDFFITLGVVW